MLTCNMVIRKAAPIVFNGQGHSRGPHFQQDAYSSGAGMLRNIVQRLLNDTIEVDFHVRLQPGQLAADTLKVRRDIETLRPGANQLLEGRTKTQVVERVRSQLPRQKIDRAIEFVRQPLRSFQLVNYRSVRVRLQSKYLEVHPQGCQLLP